MLIAKFLGQINFLIIITFLGVQFKIKDNTSHNLKVEAKNYALIKDAVSISDGNTNYVYKTNAKLIENEKCEIEAYSKEKELLPVKEYCSRKESNTIEIFGENEIEISSKNE